MLRTIMILAILAFLAFMAGWFTVDRDESQTTIKINRDEIKADASLALERGREFLNNQNDQNQTGFANDPLYSSSEYGAYQTGTGNETNSFSITPDYTQSGASGEYNSTYSTPTSGQGTLQPGPVQPRVAPWDTSYQPNTSNPRY